jgi:hypothetical protein
MKTFEAIFNVSKNKGVYGISLVEDPAMEGEFIALSKEVKVEFKTVDKEQRILMGLVLEPNKPIYRNQGGEEFNIVFSEQTIKDLSHNFFKQGFQTNSSIEHSGSIDGVSFVESWIVEDSKIDKSANFGFSYPKGSWVATMKVDSEEIWSDYVKTGKVLGFSIDAFVELKEVNLNKHSNKMEENKKFLDTVKDTIIELFSKEKEEKVELGSIAGMDGMVFMYDGETPEVGAAVWIMAEDESKVPVPVGEHPLEGGGILVVSEEGIIASIGEAKAEEPAELDEATPAVPSATDAVQAIKSLLIKYTEDAKTERIEFENKLNEKLEAMDGKLVEFSNEPASKPINSNVKQVELTKAGRLLNKIRQN